MNAQQLITQHLDIWTAAHKTRSSAGRGSNNKLDLVGIKKLRELILELAVRGKLVPQDPDDEAASMLLEKDETEKTLLIKKKKLIQDVLNEEIEINLPINWTAVTFRKIGNWAIGNGFPEVEQGNSSGEYLFCKVSDMNLLGNDKFIKSTAHTVTAEVAERLKLKLHPEGTVIFPKIGGAIATNKRRVLIRPTAIDNNCLGLIPNKAIDPQYLYRFLLSIDFTKYQAGTSVPALSQGVLEKIVFGLPPLTEQHRIVTKVDELMAFCDQLEQTQSDNITAHAQLVEALLATLTDSANHNELQTNWQRIAKHFDTLFTTEHSIDQLKQTILQLAVMGKLVPQNTNDEPASELLKKISAEKSQMIKEGKIKKEKPLPEITDEEKPFKLPSGWEWVKLDFLATKSEAGWSPQCHGHPRANGNWGVLKVSAVSWGKYNPHENKELPAPLEPRPEYEVKPGDFLISRANTAELVAKAVVVPNDTPEKLMMSDKIIRFNFSSFINLDFIQLVNNSDQARSYYAAVAGGTSSSMKNVSREQIRNLVFALPSYNEQHRIVAKVDELMALCDTLKINIQSAQTTQLALADALAEQAIN